MRIFFRVILLSVFIYALFLPASEQPIAGHVHCTDKTIKLYRDELKILKENSKLVALMLEESILENKDDSFCLEMPCSASIFLMVLDYIKDSPLKKLIIHTEDELAFAQAVNYLDIQKLLDRSIDRLGAQLIRIIKRASTQNIEKMVQFGTNPDLHALISRDLLKRSSLLYEILQGVALGKSEHIPAHICLSSQICCNKNLIAGTVAESAGSNVAKRICMWDTQQQQKMISEFAHDPSIIRAIAWHENDMITGHSDNIVRLWDVATQRCKAQYDGHTGIVCALGASDCCIVSGSADRSVFIWDTRTRKPVKCLQMHDLGVCCVDMNQGHIVSGSRDKTLHCWDRRAGSTLTRFKGHADVINAVSLNGGLVASGSRDMTIRIWDMFNLKQLDCLGEHRKSVDALKWRDQTTIVSGSRDKIIKLWDFPRRKVIQHIERKHDVCSLDWLADGRLVSAQWQQGITITDLANVYAAKKYLDNFPLTTTLKLVQARYRKFAGDQQEAQHFIGEQTKNIEDAHVRTAAAKALAVILYQ